VVRDELGRTLLDLLAAGPAERLRAVRAAAGRATRLASVADAPAIEPTTPGRGAGMRTKPLPAGVADADLAGDAADDSEAAVVRTPASERRRAAEALVSRWTDLARDLAMCAAGLAGNVRDLALLDDTSAAAARLDPAEVTAFLDRLGRAGVHVRGNVSPELVLDDLAVAWPRPIDAPTTPATRRSAAATPAT
jgi:hypothetical protein